MPDQLTRSALQRQRTEEDDMDYDDMDANELSREIAERRGDRDHPQDGSREAAEWKWPDRHKNAGYFANDPQPYASEWWAVESLVEDLDEASRGVDLRAIDNRRIEHSYEAHCGTDWKTYCVAGDTRPEAIARLWLQCDDAGLFDEPEEDESETESEYTDEELARVCDSIRDAYPQESADLQAAADRLRDLSDADVALDEIERMLGAVDVPESSAGGPMATVDAVAYLIRQVREIRDTLPSDPDVLDELREKIKHVRDYNEVVMDQVEMTPAYDHVLRLIDELEATDE